jgi:hypothetical protein
MNRAASESWVLAEGDQQGFAGSPGTGASPQGWLQEAALEIYDSESRANTASKALNL